MSLFKCNASMLSRGCLRALTAVALVTGAAGLLVVPGAQIAFADKAGGHDGDGGGSDHDNSGRGNADHDNSGRGHSKADDHHQSGIDDAADHDAGDDHGGLDDPATHDLNDNQGDDALITPPPAVN